MISRRGLSAVLLALLATGSQAQARRRIGILMPYAADDHVMQSRIGAFKSALDTLGWSVGVGLDVEERWVTDDLGRVRAAAAELAAGNPDVIVTTGSRIVPLVQQAARSTPIVFVGVSDPVGQGLVSSLARPGGNMTGFSLLELDGDRSPLMQKLFEIMVEIAPKLRRAAIMFNPNNPAHRFHARTFNETARQRGIEAVEKRIGGVRDVEAAIAAFAAAPDGVMLLPSDLTLLAHRAAIVAAMARHGMPAIYSDRSFVESGGLCSYSADRDEMFVRAAGYVSRILRGERAGDLPVQQPTRYELVLNAATARALGVTLPLAVLARADEVIE